MDMGSSGRQLKTEPERRVKERASFGAHETRVQVQSVALKDRSMDGSTEAILYLVIVSH